jgi:hypothetical protein
MVNITFYWSSQCVSLKPVSACLINCVSTYSSFARSPRADNLANSIVHQRKSGMTSRAAIAAECVFPGDPILMTPIHTPSEIAAATVFAFLIYPNDQMTLIPKWSTPNTCCSEEEGRTPILKMVVISSYFRLRATSHWCNGFIYLIHSYFIIGSPNRVSIPASCE